MPKIEQVEGKQLVTQNEFDKIFDDLEKKNEKDIDDDSPFDVADRM